MMLIAIVCSLMLGFVIGYVAGATPLSDQLDPVDAEVIRQLKERNRNAGVETKPDADH